MANTDELRRAPAESNAILTSLLVVFRGIGQIFFQEHALAGMLFVAGVLAGSPVQAIGIVAGAAIGTFTAWILRLDRQEWSAGLYGFNPALVGIATLFFFQPGVWSITLLVVGAVLATVVTWVCRRHVPFPTYTAPFVVITWVVFLVGGTLGLAGADPGAGPESSTPFVVQAVAHGVGQVMFQATLWAGILFLAGLAVGNWRHAAWVLIGSIVGMCLASYHLTTAAEALDPERLIVRSQFDNVALGLYGYNSTLAAVALFLSKRSLLPPLLGMLLAVPLTELVPQWGVPALTAPFVLATWIVLLLGRLEALLFPEPSERRLATSPK